ncbi:MAG: VOC family protein [Myxococcaceae bacterium]
MIKRVGESDVRDGRPEQISLILSRKFSVFFRPGPLTALSAGRNGPNSSQLKVNRVMEMGSGGGEYFMFGANAKESFGGMSNMALQMKMPAHWLYDVNVANCDEAAKRVTRLGGKVLNGPMDIPGGDKIAQCMDPQGAAFAIYAKGNARS